MLRERLVVAVLKMCNNFSLLIGCFPLRLPEAVSSRTYFIYCAIIHCTWLALMPFTFTSYFTELNSMAEHLLLQWLYIVSSGSKLLCIIVLIGVFWIRRLNILAIHGKTLEFFEKFKHFKSNIIPSCESIQRVRRTVDYYLLGRAVSTTANIIFHTIISYLLTPVHDWKFLRLSIFNFLLLSLLSAANFQFSLLLAKFYEHFEYINIELIDLLNRLEKFDKRLRYNVAWRHRWGDPMGCQLHQRLYSIATMHQTCYCLAKCYLKSFAFFALFVTLFKSVSNVVIVYHAVLFITHQLNVDSWGNFNGSLLTIFFYMDTIMQMRSIDMVLGACNRCAQLLRRSNELLRTQRAPRTLNKNLEQFSLQLMCRRLRFSICGLFDFDKAMGLRLLISALVNVTVLVQYDIKARSELK